jgi:succinyl-diaminopimelate desuccinylase
VSEIYKLSGSEQKLLLALLEKLVAANTVNPPGNEDRVVKVVESFLKSLGIKYRIYRKAKGRGNIVWSLGPSKKEILIAAHSDTVPVGEGWKTDPFKMVRKKGNIFGRGVVDNKSPLAGMLLATKILQEHEGGLKSKITFAAVADEERGNEFGIDYLLRKKIFKNIKAAIIPDGCGNNRLVEIAEKGVVHLRVTAFGQQGHGSMPYVSKNAIFILEDFLDQVRKLKFTKKTKLLTPVTISVGAFHAGWSANMIPGEAEALLDIRFPPNEGKTEILKKLKKLAGAQARKWKVKQFKFEILSDLPTSETSAKSEIVQKTLKAIQKISRKRAKIIGMPAFTFAGVLRSKNMPVVAMGPGDLEECHRANEKIPEKGIHEFAEILVELLRIL